MTINTQYVTPRVPALRCTPPPQLQLAYPNPNPNLSLYHHRMHHVKIPRSPCVCPFFVFVFGLCLCLPVASARAGQCFRRSPTHLPCPRVPVTCPMCTQDWHASLYRPAPLPSKPRAPIPNRRAPSPFPRHTRSPTLHTSARSRTRASDAESLIQSTLG